MFKINMLIADIRKKLLFNLLFAACLTLAFFIPDFVMNLASDANISFGIVFVALCFGFSLLLSFCGEWMKILVFVLVAIMDLIQMHCIVYFGHPITAGEINNIFLESADVFDLSYLGVVWFVTPVILLVFLAELSLLHYTNGKLLKIPFMFVVVLALLAITPYKAYKEVASWRFQPNPASPSLKNSGETFSYYLFNYLWHDAKLDSVKYQPYKVVKTADSEAQNVLLIFGESLAADHFSLFGYERKTFPKLEARMARDPLVFAVPAMSGAVGTPTSMALFFNGVREPANLDEIEKGTFNLFKLAKENGFKTYYITDQEPRLAMSLKPKYIDEMISSESNPWEFSHTRDDALLTFLKKLDLGRGKNFVVLHMCAAHSTYDKYYRDRRGEFEKFLPTDGARDRLEQSVNMYDNALLYVDYITDNAFTIFEEKSGKRPFSFYFIGDHGELFNYNGLWGHNNLVLEQAKVFLVARTGPKPEEKVVTYVDVHEMLAKDLGFETLNPNAKDGIFYLHTDNVGFPYDFLEYKVTDDGQIVELGRKNTRDLK